MPTMEEVDSRRDEVTPTDLASFWRRLAGLVIDILVLGPMTLLVAWAAPEGAPLAIAVGLALAVQLAYFILLIGRFGRTLGAYVMEIRIVRADDAEMTPGYGRATVRQLVPLAAGLVPYVGRLVTALVYFWMLWDPMKQGLHDKAARTIVIESPRPRRGVPPDSDR